MFVSFKATKGQTRVYFIFSKVVWEFYKWVTHHLCVYCFRWLVYVAISLFWWLANLKYKTKIFQWKKYIYTIVVYDVFMVIVASGMTFKLRFCFYGAALRSCDVFSNMLCVEIHCCYTSIITSKLVVLSEKRQLWISCAVLGLFC